jgi:hypothetical protein
MKRRSGRADCGPCARDKPRFVFRAKRRNFGAFTAEGASFFSILVDEAAGDITLGAMLGGLEAGSLGSLTITDADTHGYVEVSEPFSGVIDIAGSLGYIWFEDDVQGEITISEDLQSIILGGDLLTPGFIGSRSAGPSGSAAKTRESRARSGILGSACLG